MSTAERLENKNTTTANGGGQYLTFILAGEEYGVEILRVQEIRGLMKTTPIPNAPHYLVGVINLRGSIVPIVDLRARFGMEPKEADATTVVIIAHLEREGEAGIIGIVVDAVSEVYNVDAKDCQAPPDFGDLISEQFVNGLVSIDEKMIMLLDIDLLLDARIVASSTQESMQADTQQNTQEAMQEET